MPYKNCCIHNGIVEIKILSRRPSSAIYLEKDQFLIADQESRRSCLQNILLNDSRIFSMNTKTQLELYDKTIVM